MNRMLAEGQVEGGSYGGKSLGEVAAALRMIRLHRRRL